MLENLEQLIKIIRERKNSSPDTSYTNILLNDKNLSVSKVKEEMGELIETSNLALKNWDIYWSNFYSYFIYSNILQEFVSL